MASDTREQILVAAERLFAESGIEAVPLRRIIAEAGVNTAAIHYHFSSKEGLVQAVFARRCDPLNRERIALLDEVEGRTGNGTLKIEDVLYVMVAPALRIGRDAEDRTRFCRLVSRIFAEREPYLEVICNDLFREFERRFDLACRRALPGLPDDEWIWRKQLAVGAMVHMLREQDFIRRMTGGVCDLADTENATQRIVRFMAAGMAAPYLSSKRRSPHPADNPRKRRKGNPEPSAGSRLAKQKSGN